MPIGTQKDGFKLIPITEVELPKQFAPLFRYENVIGCYKGVRDLVIFTDIRIVSIDVQGVTGKQKVIETIPYTHITGMTIETSGWLDLDTDLILRTEDGTVMAYSFGNGEDVIAIQNFVAHKMM